MLLAIQEGMKVVPESALYNSFAVHHHSVAPGAESQTIEMFQQFFLGGEIQPDICLAQPWLILQRLHRAPALERITAPLIPGNEPDDVAGRLVRRGGGWTRLGGNPAAAYRNLGSAPPAGRIRSARPV